MNTTVDITASPQSPVEAVIDFDRLKGGKNPPISIQLNTGEWVWGHIIEVPGSTTIECNKWDNDWIDLYTTGVLRGSLWSNRLSTGLHHAWIDWDELAAMSRGPYKVIRAWFQGWGSSEQEGILTRNTSIDVTSADNIYVLRFAYKEPTWPYCDDGHGIKVTLYQPFKLITLHDGEYAKDTTPDLAAEAKKRSEELDAEINRMFGEDNL